MGRYRLRFRRSVGFGKLFRLNFGKRGMSVSAGVPGARKTIHLDGRQTTTFGLPGTGLSWTRIETPKRRRTRNGDLSQDEDASIGARAVTAPPEPSTAELILRVQDELRDEHGHN